MSRTNVWLGAHGRPGRCLDGAVAGLAGGAIEVVWIALYQGFVGGDAGAVARGVTQTLFPQFASAPAASSAGLAIHMGLAVLLGTVIALSLRRFLPRIAGTAVEPLAVVGVLIGVWAINFFVVLPVINPGFVGLVPYGASFVSKVLFGFAAAFVFWGAGRLRAASRNERENYDVK